MITSTRFKRLLGAAALTAMTSAVLVACGGGGGGGSVAYAPLPVAITPTTAVALTAASSGYTFPSGVSDLGLSGSTTIAFSAPTGSQTTPTFSIANGGGTATGVLGFGSCIFTITESSIPELPVGYKKEIFTCATELNIVNSTTTDATFTLGSSTSSTQILSVTIKTDGTVLVDGVEVGTATVVTGGST